MYRNARIPARRLISNVRAAIDLASIMVGVLVIAIVGGVISTSLFAVVPWAQDEAAKQSLGAVMDAESAERGAGDDHAFKSTDQLGQYLHDPTGVAVDANEDGSCYVAASRSATTETFYVTSTNPKPVKYEYGVTDTSSCVPFSDVLAQLPAVAVSMPGSGQYLKEIVGTANDYAVAPNLGAIERGLVTDPGFNNTRAAHPEITAPWTDVAPTVKPASNTQFSIGFDDGQAQPSGSDVNFGKRVGVVTFDKVYVGAVQVYGGQKVLCTLPEEINTAKAFLDAVGADLTCPTSTSGQAIVSMWAWGNSVAPTADARGNGYGEMTPENIAKFASARRLTSVNVSVPWAASNAGPIRDWVHNTVEALHNRGIKAYALGGENTWVDSPILAATWAESALASGDFDGIQFDIEPWVLGYDASVYAPKLATLFDATRAEIGGSVPVNSDLPWWLAVTDAGGQSAMDVILPHIDSAAVVVFIDHADGAGGIIQIAAPAVAKMAASGKPWTVGVETENPVTVNIGPEFTFYEEGAKALNTEAKKVKTAFKNIAGFKGVTVEHMRSWAQLRP
ncbi:hypothetical protein [Leifsonia sp. Leaf264]|uniref:hypothetical protein n=1 Tax=Leifsonia sp. Leaf264 TaxID=1736314 RepID=UPI0006FB032A|nr:hypothetical protein [Leifsonia sp. Leaf264]KQO98828.1 hypothetical protein ASF30_12255 [Leifsonia sp. Leaf264]